MDRITPLIRLAAGLPVARGRIVIEEILAAEAARSGSEDAQAAVAWERDMAPVAKALVEALEANDLAALQGLRGLLPALLSRINAHPELATQMAVMMGRALIQGMTASPTIPQ